MFNAPRGSVRECAEMHFELESVISPNRPWMLLTELSAFSSRSLAQSALASLTSAVVLCLPRLLYRPNRRDRQPGENDDLAEDH